MYNHAQPLAAVLDGLRARDLPVFVVDDGSHAECRAAIDGLLATCSALTLHPPLTLVRHVVNQGKGAAVLNGMRAALSAGFTHALQVDADGQHDLDALQALRALSGREPEALVSGRPIYDASVPRTRRYGRYLTHALVWCNTLSFAVRDSMCGFRIYPLRPCVALSERVSIGQRMDFDTDIMVRLFWSGIAVRFAPVAVTYPADGVSHFDMLRDNIRIARMHSAHFLLMLRRLGAWRLRERGRRSPAAQAPNISALPRG